jgi:ribulose-5-phosphate 4-epimerase/fuculose-1-phosphate aldolase
MSETKTLKENLAAAYQICAHLGWSDLTYTHISARLPQDDSFYIYPLGLLFQEVTVDCLLRVSLSGELLEGNTETYNPTGYAIHGVIYQKRPDIRAVYHLHTPAGVAVSSMTCGLLPISQWALHFYNRHGYHDYDALALAIDDCQQKLLRDLAMYRVLILRNHGTLTCGSTLHEAFCYAYHLEQACKAQTLALQASTPLIQPSPEVCEKAAQQLTSFESDHGLRDWLALRRFLKI